MVAPVDRLLELADRRFYQLLVVGRQLLARVQDELEKALGATTVALDLCTHTHTAGIVMSCGAKVWAARCHALTR